MLLALFAVGAGLLGDIYDSTLTVSGVEVGPIRTWQALYATGCAGFALLLWTFQHRPIRMRTIIIAATLLRLPMLLCPPNDDCHRYAWEGHIQHLGVNPYDVAPEDPSLTPYRDDIWQQVQKKHYTTIYPPLAQLAFRAYDALQYSVKTPQIAHALLDIGVILALAGLLVKLRQPPWHLAIYALCPLVMASFAHAGHNDTLMILPLIGFLAAAHAKRWLWAGFLLGLAISAKTVPVILLPLLLRRSWRAALVAMATVALAYTVYLDAGWNLLHTLYDFPSQEHFNNLLDELRIYANTYFEKPFLARDRNHIAAALLALVVLYRTLRPRDLILDTRWLLALTVLTLPIIHFWYITWVLVLIALRPRGYASWLLLTATMALYWQAEASEQAGQGWRLGTWTVAAIWLPFFAAWSAEQLASLRGNVQRD